MTVIAWDGKTLAADKRLCADSITYTVTKIHQIGNLLVGGSGDLCFVEAMIGWVRDGRNPARFPDSQRTKDNWMPLLVIEPNGQPSLYEMTPYPTRYDGRHCAIGCGREIAMTVMHLGHGARRAVEIACEIDSRCGNGIDTL